MTDEDLITLERGTIGIGTINRIGSKQEELKNKLDHPVYVLSEPPFWKVRIGDFLKREDANAYKEQISDFVDSSSSGNGFGNDFAYSEL